MRLSEQYGAWTPRVSDPEGAACGKDGKMAAGVAFEGLGKAGHERVCSGGINGGELLR